MKPTILILVLILLCFGCTPRQSDQLARQQKDQIKSEVQLVFDSLMAAHHRLDIERMLQYFWDSPEYVMYNLDGSKSDFKAFKKSSLDILNVIDSVRASVQSQEYTVLTEDYVMCSFAGNSSLFFKSGDKLKIDPEAYTWIFKRVNDQWKVAYSHESGIIAMERTGKK